MGPLAPPPAPRKFSAEDATLMARHKIYKDLCDAFYNILTAVAAASREGKFSIKVSYPGNNRNYDELVKMLENRNFTVTYAFHECKVYYFHVNWPR